MTCRGGGHVFICSINLVHLSNGTPNFSFVKGFCKLARKYADRFPFIRVTCGCSKTDNFHLFVFSIIVPVRRAVINLLCKIGLYERIRKLVRKE